VFMTTVSKCHLFNYVRWLRELNTLQLKQTHANRKKPRANRKKRHMQIEKKNLSPLAKPRPP